MYRQAIAGEEQSNTAHIQHTNDDSNNTVQQLSPSGVALRIEQVSKVFSGQSRTVEALKPVDLDIAAGEFVCLLGPSGCGKSTLLSIIAGLEPASTGVIWANDQKVRGPGTERVLLFQEAALFPWLDVQHNVEFGLRYAAKTAQGQQKGARRLFEFANVRQARAAAKERREIARRFIELVHLKGFEKSLVHQLSGGMRQRAAIARALAINPAILLMDEPFGALDALTRDRLHAELETIWSETRKTIVFVTHNVREAVALGDRVLVFSPRPGRIVRDFRIDLPRPRSLEDHRLVDMAAEVLAVLTETMNQQEQENEH